MMQYSNISTISLLVIALLFVTTGAFYQRVPSKSTAFSSSYAARHTFKIGIITRKVERTLNAVIEDFGDDEPEASSSTDAEAGKTYGYEGDFKVGDVVRVNKDIKIWSVKEYSKQGFNCEGYQGTVKELVLYGRKLKTLCSAITPVKVEFIPDGPGMPAGMFTRKWVAHFSKEELDLIEKAPAAQS